MLSDEAVKNVKLELRDCIHGLGFATSTVVLASLDAAIAKYSTIPDVSKDMVRRQQLEQMHAQINELKKLVEQKEAEIKKLKAQAESKKAAPRIDTQTKK